MARTQHLGRIKRRMYRAHCSGGSPIGPGDMLETAAQPAPSKVQVVDAQALPGGGFAVLAVIPIDVAESLPGGGVALRDGSRLTLEDLPYALQDETG